MLRLGLLTAAALIGAAASILGVCPGSPDNEPGKVHFKPLGRVTPYGGLLALLGHFGSALLNTYWDRAARRAIGLPPSA